MNQIVVVEDEANLNQSLCWAFEEQGWKVHAFPDGQACWDWYEPQHGRMAPVPVVFLLDIGMPRMDGLELCRRIRGLGTSHPLIFLTSKDEEIDRVLGLEMGADDYVCKPFSLRELLARLRIQFRRISPRAADQHRNRTVRGDLVLDTDACMAWWHDKALELTVSEFRMILCLADQAGVVKTRDQLVCAAHGEEFYLGDRVVDSHVKRLRKKLEQAFPGPSPLETVYGLGYRWTSGPARS